MHTEFKTIEDLINVILGMNGPRGPGDTALQSGLMLPTPFGKLTIRLVDYELVSDDPTLKKLKTKSAKNTTIEEILIQTVGKYRDAYRRVLAMSPFVNKGVGAIKAENTSFWLLEGKQKAEAPDAANQKWKVVAMISVEMPGEMEGLAIG